MTDIVSVGDDIGLFDTQTTRAANILSVQLGALEYAQEIGIDLDYFLREDVSFQNESFKAYLVEVLATNGINVATVTETIETLYRQFTFNLTPEETSTSLVAR